MANIDPSFTALADPTRRVLLERLGRRSLSVGALAKGLPISRPAVSQHLKVLREAGLVWSRREGTSRIYAVDPKGVEAMRDYLSKLWDQGLAAFKAEAERED